MNNAKDAAIRFEAQSIITRKDKTGWVLGLRIHPSDLPKQVILAPLGTRFSCVLFEIADDETFVVPEDIRKGKAAVSTAGQMCREESFQSWMLDKAGIHPRAGDDVEDIAANLLREYLNINSRSDLLDDEESREQFKELIMEYRDETRDRQ